MGDRILVITMMLLVGVAAMSTQQTEDMILASLGPQVIVPQCGPNGGHWRPGETIEIYGQPIISIATPEPGWEWVDLFWWLRH